MTTAAAARLPGTISRSDGWDLLHDAGDGRLEAFGTLYERYVDSVRRYIRAKVHDRNQVEDLTSETFLRVLSRAASFHDRGVSVRALLFTVARNLVLDHAKAKYTRAVVVGDELVENACANTVDTESLVIRAHRNADLMRNLQLLNDDQRACVVLRFLEGFSVPETAKALHRDVAAVRQLQFRAVRRLAALMKEEWR
ncbi:sigma-70 family RNA polymerase sigma factor [Amycolatopsis circi]|uniref:sigma-70 family RNA polymerase sigma factor n=1 Tax=Amycolatopsis circi TaxID=871959 RepID=UPI000E25DCB4|nr:sigma-70 family RNA polymerase sigma factor [Amycolatopsis circi]